jgi:hypothetical protein
MRRGSDRTGGSDRGVPPRMDERILPAAATSKPATGAIAMAWFVPEG